MRWGRAGVGCDDGMIWRNISQDETAWNICDCLHEQKPESVQQAASLS